jgi:translation initiation factor IF-2
MTDREPLKVYELAKELGIDSISLVDKLKTLEINVKNHMSELTDSDAERARAVLKTGSVSGKSAAGKSTAGKPAAGATSAKKTTAAAGTAKKVVSRRASADADAPATEVKPAKTAKAASASAEPAAKPVRIIRWRYANGYFNRFDRNRHR